MIAYYPVYLLKSKFSWYWPKIHEKQKLNFSRCAIFHVKTKNSLRFFVDDCLWKHFLASNSPQITWNLIFLTIFVTRMYFAQFQLNIIDIKLEKSARFVVLDNCFSDNLTEVKMFLLKDVQVCFINSNLYDIFWILELLIGIWKAKKALHTIIFIIFWDFLKFYQIYISPKVKQCVAITYKHGTSELLHKLVNNVRLRFLVNWEILGECLNLIER